MLKYARVVLRGGNKSMILSAGRRHLLNGPVPVVNLLSQGDCFVGYTRDEELQVVDKT